MQRKIATPHAVRSVCLTESGTPAYMVKETVTFDE